MFGGCNDEHRGGITQYIYGLSHNDIHSEMANTVWPEILAGNLFWRIGGFESNPPIFHPPKTSQCDAIIIAKS